MKNRFFIFNDINSLSKGIILKEHPIITSPALRDDGIVVEGRSGTLHYNKKVYDSFIQTLECDLIDSSINIREVSSWLKGPGKIIFSNELDKFYHVNILNQIDFTNIANKVHSFPLVIEFQPFAYSVTETTLEITENQEFTILESNEVILPKIKVYGTGDITITINNQSQILYDINEFIELDSQLEIAYKNLENKNDSVEGEYLTLVPGNNKVSFLGTVVKIEIIYRENYV